jgi:hypothetical protein
LEKDYVAIADLNKRAIALHFTKPFQKAYPSRVTFILARSPAPKKTIAGVMAKGMENAILPRRHGAIAVRTRSARSPEESVRSRV